MGKVDDVRNGGDEIFRDKFWGSLDLVISAVVRSDLFFVVGVRFLNFLDIRITSRRAYSSTSSAAAMDLEWWMPGPRECSAAPR